MFKRVLRVGVPLAVAGVLTAVAGLSQAATAPGWRIVATLPDNSSLTGLAATGAGDAWAAGTACANASCTRSTLLVRRWNGKAWTVISVPKAYVNSSASLGVSAVAATSAANAWIFNDSQAAVIAGAARAKALAGAARTAMIANAASTTSAGPTDVLHWTGKGWGATVKLPADVISAVAPAANDAWAFGAASTSASSGSAYAARYDGRKWSPVRVPVAGIRASATSASDIWVAGFSSASLSATVPAVAIMDFNGKTWRTTPVPNLGLSSKQVAFPLGIAAVSAANVWADGMIVDTSSQTNPVAKLFLLHWNGKKWAVIKVPYTGLMPGSLAQDGHGGIWMSVISFGSQGPVGYLSHYANGAWSRMAAPARSGEATVPSGLAWIPGTRSVWGTGRELPTAPSVTATPTVIFKYGA